MAHQKQPVAAGQSLDHGDGQVDDRRTVQDGLLKSVKVRNFRVFDELSIDQLSRVNLIAGRNNAGKTSSARSALPAVRGRQFSNGAQHERHSGTGLSRIKSVSVARSILETMFNAFDTGRTVEIAAVHAIRGPLTLRVSLEWPSVIELSLGDSKDISAGNQQGEPALLFSYKGGSVPRGGEPSTRGRAVHPDRPARPPVPFVAMILSTRITNDQDDAARLGRLRKQKQGSQVLDALRIIEPRLLSIEDNSASGFPMIWGISACPNSCRWR